jgi:integrative and conjugative element protein (TIGR02256 family)
MPLVVEISRPHLEEIAEELRKAGKAEIGGILLGEHLDEDHFRIVAYDINPMGDLRLGTFVRDEKSAAKRCEEFFKEKNQDFSRFNYIGEWHSHPQFEVQPSTEDDESMWSILGGAEGDPLFAVLMIVRLNRQVIECGMWAYFPNRIRNTVIVKMIE